MPYEVDIQTVPAKPLAVKKFRSTIADMGENLSAAFAAVQAQVAKANAIVTGPPVAYYEPLSEREFDVWAGFPVSAPIEVGGDVVPFELPAGEVASTIHTGSYNSLSKAYDALRAWASAQGRALKETGMWEEYLSEPSTPPSETQTGVYWPLA
jgi:effector-binding domain-containing protein